MDGFALKKAIAVFLQPVPFLLEILCLGFVLLLFCVRRRGWDEPPRHIPFLRRAGLSCVGLAIALLYLFSIDPVSTALLKPLEQRYPPLKLTDESAMAEDPAYIVVLSEGYEYDEAKPLTSQLTGVTLARVAEAVRVHKAYPEARVVFTGGKAREEFPPVSEVMANVAVLLGMEGGQIEIETEARDTPDHVRLLKERLRGKSFVLVSSASHLPRAMALFEASGLTPTAAPADIRTDPVNRHRGIGFGSFVPKLSNLDRVDTALHEYLGMLWSRMRGQLCKTPPQSATPDGGGQ